MAQVEKHILDQFKQLSEADIQAYTDSMSYNKGYTYYLNNYIFDPTLRESILKALCYGSSGGPYRVEATLASVAEKSSDKLMSYDCSCPRGGFCKHIVALLLTWLHHPERFELRSDLMVRLKEKSREELLVIMEQVLQRQPEVESLVELLLELSPSNSVQAGKTLGRSVGRTINPSVIRKQVVSAFYDSGDGWGAAATIAEELSRLCDLGDNFAEAGQWANAQVIYATIAEEAIAHYEEVEDEGDISQVIEECAVGLVNCLNVQPGLPKDEQLDAAERKELLTTLIDLWKFGHDYADIDADIVGTITKNVTEDERKMLEEWTQQEMRPGSDFSSNWHNRKMIGFLADLKGPEQFSDADLLEEYRKAGLYKDLTAKLLQLGRRDEAFTIAKEKLTDATDGTWFAEQLMLLNDVWREQAFTFVETRLEEAERPSKGKQQDFSAVHGIDTYRRWLSEKYSTYGRAEKALDIELVRFQAQPDEATYRSVQSIAQLPGQQKDLWSTLRPRLLKTLEQQNKWGALISIYLAEGEVGHALSALTQMEKQSAISLYGYGYSYRWTSSSYQLQVAKAAEAEYPDDSIRLYQRAAEKLIDARGRENYQQAAEYFTRVKQLYQRHGREAEWNAYITDLRNKNKSLRALKEELDTRNL